MRSYFFPPAERPVRTISRQSPVSQSVRLSAFYDVKLPSFCPLKLLVAAALVIAAVLVLAPLGILAAPAVVAATADLCPIDFPTDTV